ncbi:MAG: dipicolinate synthase subunit B [Oscillospiraceae bacterium]|nr:dipicolinate synthase subunit B [Oscillospiraceae bacterium]
MDLTQVKLGFALTGSFCTFRKVIDELRKISGHGVEIFPIMSQTAASTDTRFGKAADFVEEIEDICRKKVLRTIPDTEPIGPKKLIDALLIAPCTGNTLGKLAGGVTDTSVTMAAKATLRNHRPVIIAPSTNDALGASAKNIGLLMNSRNIYFVPFAQDDPVSKAASMVAKWDMLLPAVDAALEGRQLQPVIM